MLEVKDINVFYGAVHALHDVSLYVNDGEIVSVVGANGAGKSTLMWAIASVVPYSSGSIEFNGKPMPQRADEAVKKGLAIVPERRRLFVSLSVMENIIMGSWLRGKSEKEQINKDMEYCFSLFPILRQRLSQRAGTLSGGEQQMLAITRALMSRPKLLLLDEPSLGLAPIIVESLFAAIQRVRDSGVTILLVEQNATQALAISDRGYVMETGRVTRTGSGEELANDREIRRAYLGE
ncbi:MAG: ABC transporter ATP-binding protein [Synergistaceae bacterium]|nr:ABC transporter ATP-binding protein [Synergistaceae bacterium]